MGECLKGTGEVSNTDSATQFCIPKVIPEEIAQMAVHLTEYYQSQRMAYEEVLLLFALIH